MARIEIEWLSDDSDCETCGSNWAEGARVTIDGQVALELIPVASCFGDGGYWDRETVFRKVLEHLGHKVFDA